MSNLVSIKQAVAELPPGEKWQIAHWLMEDLLQQAKPSNPLEDPFSKPLTQLPDYAAQRRAIFGDEVLPNMILLSREEERW